MVVLALAYQIHVPYLYHCTNRVRSVFVITNSSARFSVGNNHSVIWRGELLRYCIALSPAVRDN